MKPTAQKFFAELSKKRPSKINLALNLDALNIIDELYDFRVKVGEFSSRNNEAMDEDARVRQMWSDLSNDGESAMSEYNSIISRANSFKEEVENTASEIGIAVSDIPYYQELQNNLNDTKEDEEALVFWVENWKNLSNT
tara:strand:+ start:34 stop:450 length:417 start_codon:yes stop_codon:yes gene_type:complete